MKEAMPWDDMRLFICLAAEEFCLADRLTCSRYVGTNNVGIYLKGPGSSEIRIMKSNDRAAFENEMRFLAYQFATALRKGPPEKPASDPSLWKDEFRRLMMFYERFMTGPVPTKDLALAALHWEFLERRSAKNAVPNV